MQELELDENLETFSKTVGQQVRGLRELISGNKFDLSSLTTKQKANLVAAINELVTRQDIIENNPVDPATLEQLAVVVSDYFVLHPQSFDYEQFTPDKTWLITHPLDHPPAVTIMDTAGSIWRGQITYPSINQVRIDFNLALSGKAVLT